MRKHNFEDSSFQIVFSPGREVEAVCFRELLGELYYKQYGALPGRIVGKIGQ